MITTPAASTHVSAVAALRSRLAGRVWGPGEEGYASATPWERSVRVRPVAVVAAAGPEDVAQAIQVANAEGCRVAVQLTGHGAVPVGDDTILVHTGRLVGCDVDPVARRVRVGAGVTWQQVLDAAARYGLAPVCGSATGVGVVGYLSGGGIGPLARPVGASSDYVESVELVTGDGQRHQVSAQQLPELFWAARGAKSLLGIVTAAEIRLLPLPELFGGCMFFAADELPDLLPAWRDWATGLPDDAGTSLAILRLPALPQIPPPLAGRTTVAVRYASLADPAHAERAFAPMLRHHTPVLGGVGRLPYAQIGAIHADPNEPTATLSATALLDVLTDSSIEHLVRSCGAGSRSPQTIVELRQLGGALDRPDRPLTTFDTVGAGYNLYVSGNPGLVEPRELAAHAEELVHATAGTGSRKLVNFVNSADPAELRRCFDAAALDRLRTLAESHDPHQVLSRPLAVACS